jgi:hypothetical protein
MRPDIVCIYSFIGISLYSEACSHYIILAWRRPYILCYEYQVSVKPHAACIVCTRTNLFAPLDRRSHNTLVLLKAWYLVYRMRMRQSHGD